MGQQYRQEINRPQLDFVKCPSRIQLGSNYFKLIIMESIDKKSFVFYLNWIDQISELDDTELRRLINNLVKYHRKEAVELVTKADRLVWQGILPGLLANEAKYNKRVEANRVNGLRGGAPLGNGNARNDKTTQNNPNNPIRDKREEINGNREKGIDNREEITEKGKLENENWEESNENRELENEDVKIEDVFYDAELVLSSTNKEAPFEIIKQCETLSMAEYYRRKNQNLK